MPATPSLRRNATWALAGNIVYAACQAGVLVVLAKLGDATDVGRFALGLAIAAPVMLFANLHLRAVQATDAVGTHPFGVYLGLRLVGIAVALTIIALTATVAVSDAISRHVVLAVGVAKAVEAVSDVLFGRLQRAERLRQIAASLMTRGLASVLVVGLALLSTGRVVVAVLALAATWALVLILHDLPAVRRLEDLRPRFEPAALGRLAWVALPLGGVLGINSLMVNVPRYTVEQAFGPAALGHFAALAYLLVAVNQPMLALGATVSPRLAHLFVTDRGAYRRLATRVTGIALALGTASIALAIILGPRVLTIVFGAEYARHSTVFVWLAAAGAVGTVASSFGYAVTAARRFAPQLVVAAVGLTVCALGTIWLVPQHGLIGAAYALLLAETSRVGCLVILYRATASAPATAAMPHAGALAPIGEGVR